MNMVNVMIRLFEVERWVVSGDFSQFPVEVLPELWSDRGVTAFGREDYVVVTEVDAVACSAVLMLRSHA